VNAMYTVVNMMLSLCTVLQEREKDRQQIAQLMRENVRLEFDRKLAGESASSDVLIQQVVESSEGDGDVMIFRLTAVTFVLFVFKNENC